MPEPSTSSPDLTRLVGLVAAACLEPGRRPAHDEEAVARLRALARGSDEHLDAPFADLGIDSLAWMSILTGLEESLGIELGDDAVMTPSAYTPRGLAAVVATALTDRTPGAPPGRTHPSREETA